MSSSACLVAARLGLHLRCALLEVYRGNGGLHLLPLASLAGLCLLEGGGERKAELPLLFVIAAATATWTRRRRCRCGGRAPLTGGGKEGAGGSGRGGARRVGLQRRRGAQTAVGPLPRRPPLRADAPHELRPRLLVGGARGRAGRSWPAASPTSAAAAASSLAGCADAERHFVAGGVDSGWSSRDCSPEVSGCAVAAAALGFRLRRRVADWNPYPAAGTLFVQVERPAFARPVNFFMGPGRIRAPLYRMCGLYP